MSVELFAKREILFTGTYLSELKERLEEINDNIETCKQQLISYAVATPKHIVSNESKENRGEIVSEINWEIKNILQEYEDYLYQRHNIELLLENEDNIEESY